MASKQHFTQQANGLYNGVTTQPDVMRQDTQADEQINFISDIARGLESRNGTKLINGIQTVYTKINNNSLVTKIDKDTRTSGDNTFTDDYIVVFTGLEHNTTTNPSGCIEIYDKNGVKQRLLNPQSTGYLITSNPRNDIKTTLIEDYLVVANSTIDTAMSALGSTDTSTSKAIIVIEALHPSSSYSVTIEGEAEQTFTTDSNPTMAEIMESTSSGLVFKLNSLTGYSATSNGNVIIIEKDSGSIRSTKITVTDTHAGTAIRAINGEVTKASDLPDNCIDGYIVNVTGVDEQNHLANYWLKFDDTSKVWKETLEPGLKTNLDAATMPHFLIKTGVVNSDSTDYNATLFDGEGGVAEDSSIIDAGLTTGSLQYKTGVAEFKFVEAGTQTLGTLTTSVTGAGYVSRKIGDEDSNPTPSIIGKPIMDLTFYRNRLVYLGQDSVVMSRSNDYFNLWNESAIGSFPTDPIDIILGSNYIVRPKYLAQYQGALLIFTENQQFILSSGEEALSPQTIRSELFTEYGTAENVYPVRLGEQLYFADTLGDNAVIRRYEVTRGNLVKDATNITAHVGTYIPKDIKFMFTVPNKNMLFVNCISEPKNLYVYACYMEDGEQVQSSWSKFSFNFDIYGAVVFDNTIYFVDKSGEMTNISKLDLFETKNQLQADQYVEQNNSNYNITESTAFDGSKEFSLPFVIERDNSLLCFATVNNELVNIHSTVLTDLQRADRESGEYLNTSKTSVPTLTDYVPEKITVSNSYLEQYNNEYVKTEGSGNAGAYRKPDSSDVIIDYNTETNHYEFKGLGADTSFPDFVADSDGLSVLPSQEIGAADNNNWKINLNLPYLGAVERDAFGKFSGNTSGGLSGNFVEMPFSSNTASPDWSMPSTDSLKIFSRLYLASDSPSGVGVFSSRNKSSANSIALIRLGDTPDCIFYLKTALVTQSYQFFIDNLFIDEWMDFELLISYGKLQLKINNVVTPIFNQSKNAAGTRKEIISITALRSISLTNTPTSPLNIMSETGQSSTAKGYVAEFKINNLTENKKLEFIGDEGTSSNAITVYSNAITDRGIYIEDDGATRTDWSEFKWVGTTYTLEWKQHHNQNYMAWYITDTATTSVIAYYPETSSTVGSDPTYIPKFGYIKQGDLYSGLGWGTALENGYTYTRDPDDNTLINTDSLVNFDTTGYDYKDNNFGIAYHINEQHNPTNNFKITLRAALSDQDNEETYYCNHSDTQGILRTGTISLGQYHHVDSSSGEVSKFLGLSFLGLNNPNHKTFQHKDPNTVFFWKHLATSGQKIENFKIVYVDTTQIKSTIDWGDGDSNELTNNVAITKTYGTSTVEAPYINGTEYLYLRPVNLPPAKPSAADKYEIEVTKEDLNSNQSKVVVYKNNQQLRLYSTKDDAVYNTNSTYEATINSYDGFNVESFYPRLMATDVYTFSTTQTNEKTPPSVKNVTANGDLYSFSLQTNLDTKETNVLEKDFDSECDCLGIVTFNGSDDYIEVANSGQNSDFDFKSDNFTIEGKADLTNDESHIRWLINKWAGAGARSWGVYVDSDGEFVITFSSDGTATSYAKVAVGDVPQTITNWKVVKDGTTVSFYFDDVQSTTLYTGEAVPATIYSHTTSTKVGGVGSSFGWDKDLYFIKVTNDTTSTVVLDYDFSNPASYTVISDDASATNHDGTINTSDLTAFWEKTLPNPLSFSINPTSKHDIADQATTYGGTKTETEQLKFEFNNASEVYDYTLDGVPKSANADSSPLLTNAGSKVTATAGGVDGIMRLNPVLYYSDCWATKPNVTYYPQKLAFGYPTESSYTLSPIFATKSNKEKISTGRFNLKALEVSFQEAVNFELQIEPKDRDPYTKEYSAKVGQILTDSPNVTKGVHKFGINSSAKELKLTIKNNSPYRSRFTGLAYEGTFINRSNIK